MSKVLTRVLVARYYQINTGFFLLLFLIMFGIINAHDTLLLHYAIMQAVTGSYLFLGIAMLVWALYNFKCIAFVLKELKQPCNSFIYNLQALSDRRQFYLLLGSHAAIYLPILLYGGATMAVGIAERHYVQAVLVGLFQLGMLAAGTGIYFNELNSTWKAPAISLPAIRIFRKKSFSLYLLHYSLYYKKGTFIAVKLCSLLLLQIMVAANSDKVSKEAICVLILFLISAHSLLPLYYVGFVENELSFLRNMPLPLMRRLGMYVLMYGLLFIPELLFLAWNEHAVLSPGIILSLYALSVTQLSLYTAILYIKQVHTERYTFIVFALFFVSLLLLATLNLWFLAAGEAIIAVVLFLLLYNGYERTVEKE